MTFTPEQQKSHRLSFISECRQKAWSAACNADHVAKSIDEISAQQAQLTEEDAKLHEDIKVAGLALDYHTVENRERRKAMQDRRTQISKTLEGLAQHKMNGQRAMQELLISVSHNLSLAGHAEKWSWEETDGTDDTVLHSEHEEEKGNEYS